MKCDIIIPVFNELGYTKKFLNSLFDDVSFKDYHLIFVDNGSYDGTLEYLKTIKNVTIIRNSENLGVAPAWNEGIEHSSAPYKLFINNDVVLSPGFLGNLIYTMESKGVKIACPHYTEGEELPPSFPRNYIVQDVIEKSDRMHGFCFCLHESVISAVGKFDERYKKWWYEDRDFETRARNLNFDIYTLKGCYVHHFGSRTLMQQPDKEAYMEKNRLLYNEKFNKVKYHMPNGDEKIEGVAYKVHSPENFPAPPSGSEIPHGAFKIYKELPDWARKACYFIEKIEIKVEDKPGTHQENVDVSHITHVKENAQIIETEMEEVIIPSPARDDKATEKTQSSKSEQEKEQPSKSVGFNCNKCGREFKSKRGLTVHQKLCKGKKS